MIALTNGQNQIDFAELYFGMVLQFLLRLYVGFAFLINGIPDMFVTTIVKPFGNIQIGFLFLGVKLNLL